MLNILWSSQRRSEKSVLLLLTGKLAGQNDMSSFNDDVAYIRLHCGPKVKSSGIQGKSPHLKAGLLKKRIGIA